MPSHHLFHWSRHLLGRIHGHVSFIGRAQFELVDKPMQIAASDPESPCTLRLAPATPLKCSQQKPAFKLPDLVLVRANNAKLIGVLSNSRGKLAHLDGLALGEHHGALYGVLKFPYVTWPGIFLESAQGGLRKSPDFLVELR